MSNFITISAKYGFKYHHAENNLAVLYKWLPADRESKVPLFATHQMGVAGKTTYFLINKADFKKGELYITRCCISSR